MAAVRARGDIGDERAVPALKKLTEGDWDGRLIRTAEETIVKLKKNIEDPASANGSKGASV
jgi:HEAT repeat protein